MLQNDGFVDLVLTTDRSAFDILLLNDPANPMMFTAENIPNSNTPSQAVALGDVDLVGVASSQGFCFVKASSSLCSGW